MFRAPPTVEVEALQEIDDLLDELARLTRSSDSPREFHAALLDRAVRALAAAAGAFWIPDRGGLWETDARVDQSAAPLIERLRASPSHCELLQATLRSRGPRLVLPGTATTDGAPSNPTDHLLLLCPVVAESDSTPIGVLEVVQRAGASPATQQGYLRLLAAVCDLAADFHQQRLLRTWQDRAARAGAVEQFAARIHASLDLDETAAAIANEGRRLTECDRLSVVDFRRGACRLLAISGQEQVDRRANIVRRLEELTRAVIAAGEPLWHGDRAAALPPQISAPLQAYLDEAHTNELAIVPLRPSAPREANERPPVLGAIVAESFSRRPSNDAFQERVDLVCRHGGLALFNAREHEALPFFPLLHALQKSRALTQARQLPRTILALVGLFAAGLALALIPADFEVTGRGVLQPALRRAVFAGSDGIVSEVRVDHGQACRCGDTLVLLTRSQLDFELSRVLGETQTARARLAGVTAARLETTPQTAADREKYNQLAAEEQELKEHLSSLAEQHAVLKTQQDELHVKSPIDGQVITWNVRDLLEARPVQRGQALLTVADLEGPWVLEIEVPDDRAGHVLAAQQSLGPALDVSFLLATDPGKAHHGRIEKVAMATEFQQDEPAHVLVTVQFDRDQVPQRRPGATVVPRIHCGHRSLGYVWFHSVWEAIQKHILF